MYLVDWFLPGLGGVRTSLAPAPQAPPTTSAAHARTPRPLQLTQTWQRSALMASGASPEAGRQSPAFGHSVTWPLKGAVTVTMSRAADVVV